MNLTALQALRQWLFVIFENPFMLWMLPILCLVFLIYFLLARGHHKRIQGPWTERYGAPVHLPTFTTQFLTFPLACQFLALCLAIIAAARPQWGDLQETQSAQSLDLVIAVDVSQSMNAEDLPPNRLERAKANIQKLLEELGPDRVALTVFAGEAYTILPFTPDHGAVAIYLSSVDTNSVT